MCIVCHVLHLKCLKYLVLAKNSCFGQPTARLLLEQLCLDGQLQEPGFNSEVLDFLLNLELQVGQYPEHQRTNWCT